jgi:hypothetical protein
MCVDNAAVESVANRAINFADVLDEEDKTDLMVGI